MSFSFRGFDLARRLPAAGLGRTLIRATLASGAVWAAGTLVTFAVGAVLARSLGPAGYGVYGTALAVVTILAVPAQLGLPFLATREVARARATDRADEIAGLARWFTIAVAGASLVLGIALGVAPRVLPLAPELRGALAAAALLLPLLALGSLAGGLLRGDGRVVANQAIDVLVRPVLFLLALGGVFAAARIGAATAILAQCVAATLVVIIAMALFVRRVPRASTRSGHALRMWVGAALPLMILEALRAVDGNYGVLIASARASIPDAGLLRVAVSAAAFVLVPVSLQNIVVAPYLARAQAQGAHDRLARIVAGSTLFMTLAVAAATIVLAIAGHWAIEAAFGAAFGPAYVPLLILSLAQLVGAVFGPSVTLLCMVGEERVVARVFALSMAAALAIAWVATPRYGINAIAASSVVAAIIRGVALRRRARQRLGLDVSLLGAGILLQV